MKDLFNNEIPKELTEQVSARYEWPKKVEGIELIVDTTSLALQHIEASLLIELLRACSIKVTHSTGVYCISLTSLPLVK